MSISVASRSHGSTPPQGSNCDRPWSLHSCGVTINTRVILFRLARAKEFEKK